MSDPAVLFKPVTGTSYFSPPLDLVDPPKEMNYRWAGFLDGYNFPMDFIITFADLERNKLPADILQFMQDTGLVATAVGVRAFARGDKKLVIFALLQEAILVVGSGITEQMTSRVRREHPGNDFKVEGKVPTARCVITSNTVLETFICVIRQGDCFPLDPPPTKDLRPLALEALGF